MKRKMKMAGTTANVRGQLHFNYDTSSADNDDDDNDSIFMLFQLRDRDFMYCNYVQQLERREVDDVRELRF